MKAATHTAILSLALAAALAGCDATSPNLPTAPSPGTAPVALPNPGPAPGTIAVAGTVSDTAWRRLAGARVDVVDGPEAGLSTTANGNGEFGLVGRFDETTHFRASKDGHVSLLRPLLARCEQCTPNWWIHFALQTLEPSIDLTGSYTVTFIADSTCSGLPQEARTRTYVATARPLPLDSSHFNVGVSGATFRDHFDGFFAGVAGDYLRIDIGDGHGSPGVVEEIAPNTYVTFDGEFKTVVADTAVIAGAFAGEVNHCSLATSWGGRRSCNSGEAIRHAQCLSPKHQLILERR